MKTPLWYSIRNGGDGSAYPVFMESKELAQLDQDYMDEGWAESCCGSVEIESEFPIYVAEVIHVDDEIKEIEDDYDEGDEYYPKERMKALRALKAKDASRT